MENLFGARSKKLKNLFGAKSKKWKNLFGARSKKWKIHLVPNDSYDNIYLAVKGLMHTIHAYPIMLRELEFVNNNTR